METASDLYDLLATHAEGLAKEEALLRNAIDAQAVPLLEARFAADELSLAQELTELALAHASARRAHPFLRRQRALAQQGAAATAAPSGSASPLHPSRPAAMTFRL